MRQIAAIIVIILISSISAASTNKKFDLDLEDGFPVRATQGTIVKIKDDKVQKEEDFVGGGCPLCDSSVYSYCDYKIFHDACCCGLPVPQCQYNDCSFLHANSCQEHQLITKCCCYSPYRSL